MRTITPEYTEKLMRESPIFATIMNTPKPDLTELHRVSMEFDQWLAGEQEKDRKIMMEALQNAR